jgi:hypothetical protein
LRSGRDRRNQRHTRGILRLLVFCSCEALTDAIAGDLETGCDAALRMAAAGEHADAARLAHGQQVNQRDDGKEKKGHLKDGRNGEGKHGHK